MEKLEILTEPNPILHEKSKKVKNFDDNLKKLAYAMAKTVSETNGTVGLAAPQVGKNIRLIVIEFDPRKYLDENEKETCKESAIPLTILVNPKITWKSKEIEFGEEGCMSLPDIELPINRHKEVHVIANDISGKKIKIRAKGYFARVLQHEIDHLDGILITDVSNIKVNRIVFMGTPEFSATILSRLIRSPYKPYLVITEPDRPSGRGKKIENSPVKILSEQERIEIWQPNKISEIKHQLIELNPDLIIVAAYGQILTKSILDIPKFGSLNVHPSLLPKYRGPTPIQTAILNGDKKTGVTIIKMDEKIDHGPILSQAELNLPINITTPTLSHNLAYIGGNLLVKTIALCLHKAIKPTVQKEKQATFTKLINKEDGKIDWNKSGSEIVRQINAYTSWPGSYTILDGKRLKICQAHIENDRLVIDKVQMEGKKEIGFSDFIRGYHKNIDFLAKIN
jgi:methionyl-tRNA formyltransferase